MVGLAYSMRGQFFDRRVVTDMLSKFEVRTLRRIGGRLRLVSRRSIKRKRPLKRPVRRRGESPAAFTRRMERFVHRQASRVSRPGRPVFSWSHHPVMTMKNIIFAYDRQRHSVVTGPVLSSSSRSPTVPELLEGGGTAVIDEVEHNGVWRPTGKRFAARYRGKKRQRRVKVRPRPTMGLTFEQEKPNIPLIMAGQT